MTTENPNDALRHGVDHAVEQSRHSILDKFLLSSLVFGFIAAAITIMRDLEIGFQLRNALSNLVLVAFIFLAWIFRRGISFKLKAAILFLAYMTIAVKQLFLFGPISGTHLFLCFCCMILMLTLSIRQSLYVSLVAGLIFPLVAYLHFSGIYPLYHDVELINSSVGVWLNSYAIFLITVFITIIGMGQLRQELNKNFELLRKTVVDLDEANHQLKEEISLKNEYAESLLVSSKKFESLFEGSRDGVFLLNSDAHIIEANQAVMDTSGYSLDELKKIKIFQLVDERFRQHSIERFEKNIKGDLQSELNETTIIRKDGTSLQVEINSNLIVADDEVMILSTVRDISFRKQMEKEKFNAALGAEERERERFSKDLHDDLGPVFSTLNLYLQTLSAKETDKEKQNILNNLSGIVDGAVKQVREISHNLSPYLLRTSGLVGAVRNHLRHYQQNNILQTELISTIEEDLRLIHNVEIVLYRIFLELLNNTVKHSGATKVRLELSTNQNHFNFLYADNGKGFDVQQSKAGEGIGLKNIETRVKALDGNVQFKYQNLEMSIVIKIPL